MVHISWIVGYDDEKLYVLDTGDRGYKEFAVDYEQARKAIKDANIPSYVADIIFDTEIEMFTFEDVRKNAKKINESIDSVLSCINSLWQIDEFSDESLLSVILMMQTHMYSLQNRQKINAVMAKNFGKTDEFGNDYIYLKFKELEQDYDILKKRCLQAEVRKNKRKIIDEVRQKLVFYLCEEKGLWTKLCNL